MIRAPRSVDALESLGRVRLSPSFFIREVLYSEIPSHDGVANVLEEPDLAIENGKRLCEEFLEPLQVTFARACVRSVYRSREVNALRNEKGHNCGSNAQMCAFQLMDRGLKYGRNAVTSVRNVPAMVAVNTTLPL